MVAQAPDGTLPPSDLEIQRDLFVAAMMQSMEDKPVERDRAIALALYYSQELYIQLAQTMALVQQGGLGGIMKMLRGK